MYNILIADDHPLFREAICNVIRSDFPDCTIIETADLDSTLLLACERDDLDLILLDLNMPGMSGLNGLMSLRNEAPTIPVVIVSAEQDKHIVLQAITYGAVGFITKSTPRKQLQVLERMAKGEANKQIAYNLDIAETTVKAHVSAILRKLNVHNRVQAILSVGDIDFSTYLRR